MTIVRAAIDMDSKIRTTGKQNMIVKEHKLLNEMYSVINCLLY